MIMITFMIIIIMIIMQDSAIMHVELCGQATERFKTYDHYINQFEMIWCREVKSTQNHSFKERYLGKFKFTKIKTDA